jgi:uncharacterized protein (DUF1778 family)
MRRDKTERFRVTYEEQEQIEIASVISDTSKSEIIRAGALKEAKKILREIKKSKKDEN